MLNDACMTDQFYISEVTGDRQLYMPLLLIGDESEAMIGRYLDRGRLYVGRIDDVPVAVCLVTVESDNVVEIKNLAVSQEWRRRGLGRMMLSHVEKIHRGKTGILGTGETPSTLRFYRSCGYTDFRRIPGFFTENYPEPIVEEGIRLCDMIYLRKHY